MDDHDEQFGGCGGGNGHDTGDCEDAIRRLYHYLDGELTLLRREQIAQHLAECSPCLEAFDFEMELRVVIARKCRDVVPDSLKERVWKALEQSGMPTSGEYPWE
jgi:mycothiol system anti-sigma-R factor